MTFLNSAFLFALAAVSIPLIIHFLSKRRIKTIEFSSLKFLEQMQKNRMKWLKMKELLLLLLRMIIIGLIVMAFARPTLKGFLGSSKAASSVVILLDRSASMETEGETGTLFEEAKRFAGRLIEALEPADLVSVISFPGGPESASIERVNPGRLLKEKLSKIEISYQKGNIAEALKTALEIMDKSPDLNREIYLISDGQRINWKNLPPEILDMDSWKEIHLYNITFSPIRDDNIAIVEVKTPPQLLSPGENIMLTAELENSRKGTVENVLAGVTVDGERRAQTTVSLPSGRTQAVDFTFKLDAPGYHAGYVEIGYDNYGLDNKRFFSLQIPERINLLAVSQSVEDLRFLRLALDRQEAGQIKFSGIAVADLLKENLSSFSVILLHDIRSLDPAREKALEKFAQDGGGLMVALGRLSEPRFWGGFLKKLAGIDAGDLAGEKGEYIYWDKFDLDHPVFSIYSDNAAAAKEADIPRIKLNLYRNLTGGNIIGSSSSGANLLAESLNKPVLIYASGLDLQSGELPAHPFFLPFLVRSIEYLGSRNADFGFAGVVGLPFRWTVESTAGEYSLIAPDNTAERLKTAGTSSRVYVSGAVYKEPGIYTLKSDGETVSLLAFNVDPVESDINRTETDDINEILGIETRELDSNSDIKTSIKEARFGRELWKEFLAIALLLLIFESLLGRTAPPKAIEK
ncbi:MAG: BatA domain-containing protein [Candidatus Zixiibacteriota bacterium]|nr:MAG: BatA domain-containing protein [candidate division Zixibacteria bacterium]